MELATEKKRKPSIDEWFRRLSIHEPPKGQGLVEPVPLAHNAPTLSAGTKLTVERPALGNIPVNTDVPMNTDTKFPKHVQQENASFQPEVLEKVEILDEAQQQAYLDKMFEEQAREKLKDLAKVQIPTHLLKSTLQPHQEDGIRWLVSQEKGNRTNPFFKQFERTDGTVYFRSSLTGHHQHVPPKQIHGAILADAMGLGKTLQTLGLILSHPPKDHVYSTNPGTSKADGRFATLIVTPVTVTENWSEQVDKHIHSGVLRLTTYAGPKRKKLLPSIKRGLFDVVVVSYDTLRAEYDSIKKALASSDEEKSIPPPTLFDCEYHRLCLDEGHAIRNHKTGYFKAVSNVVASNKICLTGTPFLNSMTDIYSLLCFLGFEPLNKFEVFQTTITDMVRVGRPCGLARVRVAMGHVSLRRTKNMVDLKLPPRTLILKKTAFPEGEHKVIHDTLYFTAKAAFAAILSADEDDDSTKGAMRNMFAIVLRVRQACCSATLLSRTHREKLKSFAEEIELVDLANLSPKQGVKLLEDLHTCVRDEKTKEVANDDESKGQKPAIVAETSPQIAALMTAVVGKNIKSSSELNIEHVKNNIGQSSEPLVVPPSPKIQTLLQSIASMESDEKGVIFSFFTSFLDEIEVALTKCDHSFVRIDGKVDSGSRGKLIRAFNAETTGPRFMLCSLKAGGTGINLTRGSHVFLMDEWFNEGIMQQAADRVHRFGQTRPVYVHHLIMENSIEQRMLSLQKTKAMIGRGSMEKLSALDESRVKLTALRDLFEIEEDDKYIEDDFLVDDDKFMMDD